MVSFYDRVLTNPTEWQVRRSRRPERLPSRAPRGR